MSLLMEISQNLQDGDADAVRELTERAVSEGMGAQKILNEGLLHGMGIVGEKFKANEFYVPDVLMSARAMSFGTEVIKPLLLEEGAKQVGKVVIGTVKGDLHDIGKNLVRLMMEGKGLDVIDLGTDVSPEAFVSRAIEEGADIVACSALLTTTMMQMAEVVKELDAKGVRDQITLMIGGAPITQEYCDKIGADLYTPDAATAADEAHRVCVA